MNRTRHLGPPATRSDWEEDKVHPHPPLLTEDQTKEPSWLLEKTSRYIPNGNCGDLEAGHLHY